VAIISGTGVGQVVQISSNTSTVITLSASWIVTPDTTSVYTVDGYVNRHTIITGNTLNAAQSTGAVDFYTKSYDCIVDGNTIGNSGGVITNQTLSPSALRADYAYFDYVANNALTGGTNPSSPSTHNFLTIGNNAWMGSSGSGTPLATVAYGDEYRNNSVTGTGTATAAANSGINFGEGGSATSFAFAQGVIAESNTVSGVPYGLYLWNTVYDSLRKGNTLTGNGSCMNEQSSVRVMGYADPPSPDCVGVFVGGWL
jgi:hypothetical protein